MTKKLSLAFVVALVVSAFFSAAALANCGKCGADKAGCASKASDKKECAGMKDKACCAHQKDMMAAMTALQKDLATMEKGVPAADQAAFMKEHQANLKKFVDGHAACQKECKMKADSKDAPKAAATDEKATSKS